MENDEVYFEIDHEIEGLLKVINEYTTKNLTDPNIRLSLFINKNPNFANITKPNKVKPISADNMLKRLLKGVKCPKCGLKYLFINKGTVWCGHQDCQFVAFEAEEETF